MLPHLPVQDCAWVLQRARESFHALRLYGYLQKYGLANHFLLGNHLVIMLAEVGSIHTAHRILGSLTHQNEHAWTSIIAGYVKHGKPRHAFNVYEEMQKETNVHPSGHTFVALLKSCTKMKDLDRGLEVHSQIEELGLKQNDVFICSTLVDMYAKCGSLVQAQQAFDKLSVRNVVCWNALISAYVEHGHVEQALKHFKKMQFESVSPDAVTFICSLKACSSTGAVDKGQEIHADIERRHLLEKNLNVGNALIDMYAKCGLTCMAQQMFDRLQVRDVVTWTALIAGYAEHGPDDKALECFELMKLNGICPNAVTFICSLKACGNLRAIDMGQEIHANIEREDLLERDTVVGNALIDMYMKCGSVTKAKQIFDKLPLRDVISWTSLITGYSDHGLSEEAVKFFEDMELDGVCSDSITLISMLKACGNAKAIDKGHEIHAEIERQGFLARNLVVGNTLVDMYAKCGLLVKSRQVFNRLPVRNLIAWNTLMAGYAELGDGEETVDCYERMQRDGVSPDAVTFVCCMKACGSIGAAGKGQEIHAEIERRGILERDHLIGSTLVDMYARCGLPEKAQEVLDKLLVQDVVSWTSLMEGYAQLGESENVFHVFDRMLEEHIKPDSVTFIVILSTCSQKGLFTKSLTYFEAMSKEFGIFPAIEHHTCVIDLLVRAGHVDKAVGMMNKLPFCPNLVAWRTVLSACRKWENLAHAKHAFEHTVHLDGNDTGAYLCMSPERGASKVEAVSV